MAIILRGRFTINHLPTIYCYRDTFFLCTVHANIYVQVLLQNYSEDFLGRLYA